MARQESLVLSRPWPDPCPGYERTKISRPYNYSTIRYSTALRRLRRQIISTLHPLSMVFRSAGTTRQQQKKDRAIGTLFFIQETGIRFSHHMPSGQGKKELLSLSRGTIQHTTATTATYATLLLKKLAAAASTTTTTNYTEMK